MPLILLLKRQGLQAFMAMLALVLGFELGACTGPSTATTVLPLKETVEVSVRQLVEHSADYGDKSLSLTGTIVVECPEGCWFFLDDGTGKLYIDLKPAGLTIPQKIGSRVTLSGRITGSGGNLQFLGEDVRFLDEK